MLCHPNQSVSVSVTCDTRDTSLLWVSQDTERRRHYLIPAPSDQPARAYWGDLACVMNVIFSEPTRRLLARAVCHNPSKQITRQGPCWRKGTDLGSLSDPRLEMQKTLSEVGWQRQETAKAFFLWHMNMRRKGKTINNTTKYVFAAKFYDFASKISPLIFNDLAAILNDLAANLFQIRR